MKTVHAMGLLGLAGLGALPAAPAFAQDASHYYGGLSVGQSRARIDEERITARLLGEGLATSSIVSDEKDNAYKVFGGYQINRNFAVEAGLFKLGKFGFTSTTVPAGTLTGQIKLQGINLDLVGTFPLSERLSALARLGVQAARAQDSFVGTGAVNVTDPNPSRRATGVKFGAGLQYEISPSVWLRGEAERYRINDAVGNRGDVNMVSLSLVFPFGRAPAPAPRVAAVAPPPPVEAPPPPPPPVVVAPPVAPVVAPPVRRRVSFAAESLLSFDRSELRPEGRAALDTFASELSGTEFDTITVEGHTDRLGSEAYNQALSERRAEVVKNYLAATGKVSAAKISAVGMGESKPVTQPGDCKGNTPSPKLIACLQPDRRVEIEVVGTR